MERGEAKGHRKSSAVSLSHCSSGAKEGRPAQTHACIVYFTSTYQPVSSRLQICVLPSSLFSVPYHTPSYSPLLCLANRMKEGSCEGSFPNNLSDHLLLDNFIPQGVGMRDSYGSGKSEPTHSNLSFPPLSPTLPSPLDRGR